MRVLLLNDIQSFSGAEVIFNSIAEELKRRGHETRRVVREEIPSLWGIVEEFKPDIIHQHNCTHIGAATLTFMRRFPSVQTFHDYWPICRCRDHFVDGKVCSLVDKDGGRCRACPNYLGALRSPTFVKHMWGKDTHIVFTAVSEYTANKIMEFGYEEVIPIWNGIEIREDIHDSVDEGFVFVPAKADRAIKKGVHIIDAIAGQLPGVRFIHAGGGEAKNMKSVGLLSREELWDYYKKCSMAIIPSIWEEPNGLPCEEAMMYGKVILGFKVGGIPEYIRHYVAGDPQEMKALIEKLMGDPETRKALGEENRRVFLKYFTLEAMVNRYMEVYDRAIDRLKERGPK